MVDLQILSLMRDVLSRSHMLVMMLANSRRRSVELGCIMSGWVGSGLVVQHLLIG